MTDLTKLYRDPSHKFPVYYLISSEKIGPEGDQLTVSKWGRWQGRASTRRYQIHDKSGVELFDTDDCYDGGNAIHKIMAWLEEYERKYNATHAAPAATEA